MQGIILSQSVIKSFIVLGFLLFFLVFFFVSLVRDPKHFSKYEALKTGWQLVWKNLLFFIPLLVVSYILFFLPELITMILSSAFKIQNLSLQANIFNPSSISFYAWIMLLVKLACMGLVGTGLVRILFDILDNKKPNLKTLFSQWRFIIPFVIACVIYKILVFLGLIFFVVPAIIIGVMFSLWSFFMIDKGYGPIKSLTASLQTVQGVKVWDLFLFLVLLGAINVLGLLVFGIGLFVTIPLTLLAFTHVYRQLIMSNEQVLSNVSSSPEFTAPPPQVVSPPKTTHSRKK